uniref:DNA-directed DNA polymerase n=1 Tax=Psilocybe cubensis TaxID=181762 RepID=A0A8H8CPU2_PSICU
MAKKRYVGFKYENIDDAEPTFDAKGIETVRRDSVNAQRKMVETCLKILFRTQDLSKVKDYCCRSWTKLLENKASVYDFIFAKEVKMGTYSDRGPPPPGAVVAARRMVFDSSNEPQYGDRIPYVIVQNMQHGPRLVDKAMDPLEFMNHSELRLDAMYYINRVLIPPLERIFNLVGADVKQWFNEMPKHATLELVSPRKPRAGTTSQPETIERINIDAHFFNNQCLSCGDPADQSSAPPEPIHCESLDCPWFYARRKSEAAMELIPLFINLIEEIEERDKESDNGRQSESLVYDLEESSASDFYVEDSMEE